MHVIRTIPTTYYPGLAQISPLAKNSAQSTPPTTTAPATTTKPPSTTTSSPASGATQVVYGQCGGIGYTGPTVSDASPNPLQSFHAERTDTFRSARLEVRARIRVRTIASVSHDTCAVGDVNYSLSRLGLHRLCRLSVLRVAKSICFRFILGKVYYCLRYLDIRVILCLRFVLRLKISRCMSHVPLQDE